MNLTCWVTNWKSNKFVKKNNFILIYFNSEFLNHAPWFMLHIGVLLDTHKKWGVFKKSSTVFMTKLPITICAEILWIQHELYVRCFWLYFKWYQESDIWRSHFTSFSLKIALVTLKYIFYIYLAMQVAIFRLGPNSLTPISFKSWSFSVKNTWRSISCCTKTCSYLHIPILSKASVKELWDGYDMSYILKSDIYLPLFYLHLL